MRQHAQVKEYSPVTNRIRLACTAAALVPLAVLAAACSSSSGGGSGSSHTPKSAPMMGAPLPSKPNSKPASLTETGSTLLFPLFGTWATAYQKQFVNSAGSPIVTITTGGTG